MRIFQHVNLLLVRLQWRIQGRGLGRPAPPPPLPLFLDQNEARRAEKRISETGPSPPLFPYLRVCISGPPLI